MEDKELQNALYTTLTWLYNQIQTGGDATQALSERIDEVENRFETTTQDKIDPETGEPVLDPETGEPVQETVPSQISFNDETGKAEIDWANVGTIPAENIPSGAFDSLFVVDTKEQMTQVEVGGETGINQGDAVLCKEDGLVYYLTRDVIAEPVDAEHPLTADDFALYTTTWDSLSGKPVFENAVVGVPASTSIEGTVAELLEDDAEIITGLKAFMKEHDIVTGEIPASLLV